MDQLNTSAVEQEAGADENRVGPLGRKCCESRIDFAAGAGVADLDSQPSGAGRCFDLRKVVSVAGANGSTITANLTAPGTRVRSNSNRFAVNSALKKLIPVRLPSGRARLATRPDPTGSSLTPKTIGTVAVTAFAALAGAFRKVTSTATSR